jgi:two-component system sensor histidine kinase RegB
LLVSFFVGKVSGEGRRKEREILSMQKQLARNQRLASLVTLSAGAAHEIATPLSTIAVIANEIERAASLNAQESFLEDARLIRSQVERCRAILERMGAQGADPLGEAPVPVSLGELIDDVRNRFPADRARIRVRLEGAAAWGLPRKAAIEALAALVKNALDASAAGGSIDLKAEATPRRLRFSVHDEGEGMTPEVLERVSEPFFTTKPPGKGMGLGAFLAYLFAQSMGGELSFQSQSGQGCTAVLELPVLGASRAPTATESVSHVETGG